MMKSQKVVGGLLVIALVMGFAVVSRAAMPTLGGLRTSNPCNALNSQTRSALNWGEFSRGDLIEAGSTEVESHDSSVDPSLQYLVQNSDYVALVEVTNIGQVRYDTASGLGPAAANSQAVGGMPRKFAPVLLASRKSLKPAGPVGDVCGFIAPVWFRSGPRDAAYASMLSSRLAPGLQGVAFMNAVRPDHSPWLDFLTLHSAQADRLPGANLRVVLIGAFFPIEGDNVVGFGSKESVSGFSAKVASEISASQ